MAFSISPVLVPGQTRGPPFALLVTFVTPRTLYSTFLDSDRTQFESCFFTSL